MEKFVTNPRSELKTVPDIRSAMDTFLDFVIQFANVAKDNPDLMKKLGDVLPF